MNILFLGAPGSGKGTQSKNIEERFNIPQISTGDLLRAETASESKMGQELKNIMSSGKFVNDDIVLKLVSKKITSRDCKNGFIRDKNKSCFKFHEVSKLRNWIRVGLGPGQFSAARPGPGNLGEVGPGTRGLIARPQLFFRLCESLLVGFGP